MWGNRNTKTFKKIIKDFTKKNDFEITNPKKDSEGFPISFEVIKIVTKNELRNQKIHKHLFGDVMTLFPNKEKTSVNIVLGSNGNDKRIIRTLTKRYKWKKPFNSYDHNDEPQWMVLFELKITDKMDTLKEFLMEYSQLREQFVMNHPENREKNPIFIYGIKEYMVDNEKIVIAHIMEKEDWIHFGEYIYEIYHESSEPIKEVMNKYGLHYNEHLGFEEKETNIKLKEKLNQSRNIEFCLEFQEYLNEKMSHQYI